MLKRLICAVLSFILLTAWSGSFSSPTLQARDLDMILRTDPDLYVLEDSFLHAYVITSDAAWINIELQMGQQTVIWQEQVETSAQLEKHLQIPVVYPLTQDFELVIHAVSMSTGSISSIKRKFIIQKKQRGNYSLQGRVLECSPFHKIGLEGAMIEIISGPSSGRETTEDEGYFTFSQLPMGPYKLRISHPCSSQAVEKVVMLDEKTLFQEWCLQTYRIPDMDLWLNKPSGSVFEVGETMTVHMRSSIAMKADLMITDFRETRPLVKGIQLREDEIQRFFWKPTLSQRLGKIDLSLVPVEKNLCGEARYQFQLISNFQSGVIRGRVHQAGKPMPMVVVYLPLQSNEHVWTDERGYFEIPDVIPGIHVVRVMTSDEMYADRHGIEVSKGQMTDVIDIGLPNENISFELNPPEIHATTHERREKRVPLTISLSEGAMDQVRIQILEGPSEISVFPTTLPSLLREKRRVWLIIPEHCPIGDYPVRLRVGNDLHSAEWKGMIQVTGLSRGTFDGSITPMQKIAIQGETTDFVFRAEKFTNFNSLIKLDPVALPPYTECITEDAQRAPANIGFQLRTSMSTPPGQYTVWMKASGDDLSSWHSVQFEVLKSGGTLASIPEKVWNPIVSAGQRMQSVISLWSPKGETRHVRLQLAFGPSWLSFENRNVGIVGEKPMEVPISIHPPVHAIAGAYPYSINLVFGERSEGFFKLEGQIYVLENQLDVPTNLRARHIREEGSVMLTWGPPAEGIDQIVGYNIYRSLRYPTLDYAVPLNYSLITDRMYMDEDFLIGRSYWYIVKAVRNDGSISPRSNTAEIRILPSDPFSAQVSFDKGEKAVCFAGEQVSVSVLASHSASVEVWFKQREWSVLVGTYQVIAQQKQQLFFQVPDLEGETTIETLLVHADGQKYLSQHSTFIRKNQNGKLAFHGRLISSLDHSELSHARIWTWDGPTRAQSYTDDEGRFHLESLSEGMYRWMVEYGGSKTLTDAWYVDADNDGNAQTVNLPLLNANPLYAWLMPSEVQEIYDPGDSFALSVFSSFHSHISFFIEYRGIRRPLLTMREIHPHQVIAEELNIPNDIPPGQAYCLIESDQPAGLVRMPLWVSTTDDKWQGRVEDIFGNPIRAAEIITEESHQLLGKTNEWGFFSIESPGVDIQIQRQGFEKLHIPLIETEKFAWTMNYAYQSIYLQDEAITVSDDFTEFEWWLSLTNGWLPDSFIEIYSGIKPPIEEGVPEPPETPWRKYSRMDLYPGHSYRLVTDGLPLSPDARLEWNHREDSYVIPVHKGLSYRWYAETLPEIPIMYPGTSDQVELDLYSYGYYRSIVRAQVRAHTPGINAWLLPERYISGQLMRLMIEFPDDIPSGIHLFSLKLMLEDRTEVRTIPLYVAPKKAEVMKEYYWKPTIYQTTNVDQRFYFSEGITEPRLMPSIPEGVSVRYLNNAVSVQINPHKTGKLELSLPVFREDKQVAKINILAHSIEKKSWKVPDLEVSSEREGALLKMDYDTYPMYCKIYRSHRYNNPIPVHKGWLDSPEYLDKLVNEREFYRYQLLATDGKLEAAWSNTVDIFYRQLFLILNFKDGYVTNRNQIEWKGSISIGSSLFINNQAIPLDRHGVFARTYTLQEGPNRFEFRVEDDSGNQLIEERTVYRDTQAPFIELISPDHIIAHTLDGKMTLRIKTEPNAYLSVNGVLVRLDENGMGIYEAPLLLGRNLFDWISTDLAGNQGKMTLTIYRHRAKRLLKLQIGHATAYIDEKSIALEAPPLVLDGRTLVPLRFIAEAMGSKVDWISASKEILIRVGDRSIRLQVGVKAATINQNEVVELDVPPLIINGRTLVPLRFIAEVMGGEVEWFAESKQIHVHVWVWETTS